MASALKEYTFKPAISTRALPKQSLADQMAEKVKKMTESDSHFISLNSAAIKPEPEGRQEQSSPSPQPRTTYMSKHLQDLE